MIADKETNFLYLADTLPQRFPGFYQAFEKALHAADVSYALLPGTKDIWARDYMPVQLDAGRFVQFVYQPSYLTGSASGRETISDVNSIISALGLKAKRSNVVLDGGNVVKTNGAVLMTDRVFKENAAYEKHKLIDTISRELETDRLYILPHLPDDFTGHADGMVRFLDAQTVLVNDFYGESKSFKKRLTTAFKRAGLNTELIPYNVYSNKDTMNACGCYINYLQMAGHLFVPQYGIAEDEQVIQRLEQLFPQDKIVAVPSVDIAREGGVLNCISWNVLQAGMGSAF